MACIPTSVLCAFALDHYQALCISVYLFRHYPFFCFRKPPTMLKKQPVSPTLRHLTSARMFFTWSSASTSTLLRLHLTAHRSCPFYVCKDCAGFSVYSVMPTVNSQQTPPVGHAPPLTESSWRLKGVCYVTLWENDIRQTELLSTTKKLPESNRNAENKSYHCPCAPKIYSASLLWV